MGAIRVRLIPFDLTASDYREYYIWRTVAKLWRFVLIVGLALTALTTWSDYCKCDYVTARKVAWNAAEGFGFALLIAVMIVLLGAITSKRLHSSLARVHQDLALGWDIDGMALKSAFASAKYPWDLIEQWSETRSLLVGFLSPYAPLFIPKRVLSEEEIADLRQRIASSPMAKKQN
jgi:YcxB-like protein